MKLKYFFLIAFVLRFLLSFVTWHPDVFNHIDWGIRFWDYGPKDFYTQNVWSFTWPNQPPGTMYIVAGIRKLYELIFSMFWFINVNFPLFPSNLIFKIEERLYPALLKLPSILADLGIAYVIYKLLNEIGKKKAARLGALLFLFNPVVWYNSSLWGQTDSIINFFVLLAFYFLFKRKIFWSILSLALCFYVKASLLIFLPIYLVVLFRQKTRLRELIKSVVLTLIFIGLLTLPFADKNPYYWLYDLYRSKVFAQQLQVITANAFNLWTLVTGIDEKPHTLLWGITSFKNWGVVLFAFSYIPPLIACIRRQDVKTVFWSLSIIAISSFMLLTNMHERYLYPFFPVFTLIAATNLNLGVVYIIVSLINLVNLYNFWWYPRVESLVFLLEWNKRFATRILSAVSLVVFVYIYRRFFRQNPKGTL